MKARMVKELAGNEKQGEKGIQVELTQVKMMMMMPTGKTNAQLIVGEANQSNVRRW